MKIKNGTIRNINNRFLAGTLSLVVLTTSLTGCSEKKQHTYFTYETDPNTSQSTLVGQIDFDKLKECYFIEIENQKFDVKEYYICYKRDTIGYYCYYDIEGYEPVFKKSKF